MYLGTQGQSANDGELRTYKEIEYPYMLMPDHVPEISGENARRVGFAYCYG